MGDALTQAGADKRRQIHFRANGTPPTLAPRSLFRPNCMMDTKEIRLFRFRQIWRDEFGESIAAMARRLDKSSNQIRFYLNPEKSGGRWMGEGFAREVEARLGKSKGFLDLERDEVGSSHPETLNTAGAAFSGQEQIPDVQKLRAAFVAMCEACGTTLEEVYLAQEGAAKKPRPSVRITSGDMPEPSQPEL